MDKYKVIFTKIFKEELQDIFFYIKFFLKEPNIATQIYNKIIFFITGLNYFPMRYCKIKNSKNVNLHRLIVNNYIIFYEVNIFKKEVYIIHIFHNTQNYLNIL